MENNLLIALVETLKENVKASSNAIAHVPCYKVSINRLKSKI
jgi:hypothetical protein